MAAARLETVKVLAFDVFGTVVDVLGSLTRSMASLGNAADFAQAWVGHYASGVAPVRNWEQPWASVDSINRSALDSLLPQFGIHNATDEEKDRLNGFWRRLTPWPDAVQGLQRLHTRFRLITLANGNVSLLTDLAENAGLPFDGILSAELIKRYKPDADVYRMAAERMGVAQNQLTMVPRTKYDLRAAAAVGCTTAFVDRGTPEPSWPNEAFDIMTHDFNDLARQLGV
jgi:2-haloacid dehalogenase